MSDPDLYAAADPDDDVARATRELGEPDALFRVSPRWFRAKLAVGLGLILYGVVANYLWWVHGPGRGGHIQFELLLLPPIIGGGLLVFMYRNRGLRVLVYPTGVLRLRPGGVESFPWDEVTEVRLKLDPAGEPRFARDDAGRPTACWLPAKVPTFQVWNAWVEVERADGTEARFSPALADYPALAEHIQRGTFVVLWPKVLAKLARGGEVEFGDLSVGPAGLRAGKQTLRWADVADVTVSQKTLSVKRSGGWLPWFAKEVTAVPNPHLLLALADVLRPAAPPAAPAEPAAGD